MSATFKPLETFKEGSEKEWPSKLGGLDWDFTRIVFTKRTLIEFLRYTGTSVDPNLQNIAKLPRYADIGSLEGDEHPSVPGISKASQAGTVSSTNDDYRPSRRVRTVPGGAQSFTLGDGSDEPFETPSKSMQSLSISSEQVEEFPEAEETGQTNEVTADAAFKPSRRVRTGPGGDSTMANLWDDHTEPEKFKPTRRVREVPGGTDNISQIF